MEKVMERLAGAIIIQAAKDWGDETKQPEIQEFLASPWFNDLVELAGFEAKQAAALRSKLITGNYTKVEIRATYR